MIDNSYIKSKLQFRCLSHLPQDQIITILQEIDRNSQHKLSTEKIPPTERISPQVLPPQRSTWSGQQQQQQQQQQQHQGQIQGLNVMGQKRGRERIDNEDSPIRKFVKEPAVGKLNYQYVVTWYEKLALENLVGVGNGNTSGREVMRRA